MNKQRTCRPSQCADSPLQPVTSHTDVRGVSVSYRYDTLSRVTAVTYPPLATMIAALLAVARIPAFWHAGNDKKMMN